jgi:two-component system LytT family response regulator
MPKIWKALIIDDETVARQRLKRLLDTHDTIEVIGEASNGSEAIFQIEQLKPDLVFLDIEMPVHNGFEVLKRLTVQPKVIFTTAYDQYAVKAFDAESIDYLLKPIEKERLAKAINRLEQLQPEMYALPIEELIQQLYPKKEIRSLTVKLGDRILLIKLTDLCFIDAEDKYVFLNTLDGKRHLTEFTLSALELKLPDAFIRISKSVILNTALIKEIRKGFNGTFNFIMTDVNGQKLSSGRSYSTALKKYLDI